MYHGSLRPASRFRVFGQNERKRQNGVAHGLRGGRVSSSASRMLAESSVKNLRTPTRPICVILFHHDEYSALLLNPRGKEVSTNDCVWVSGPYQAIGMLEDKGYELSRVVRSTIPKWVSNRIPKPYEVFGTCNITSFPF